VAATVVSFLYPARTKISDNKIRPRAGTKFSKAFIAIPSIYLSAAPAVTSSKPPKLSTIYGVNRDQGGVSGALAGVARLDTDESSTNVRVAISRSRLRLSVAEHLGGNHYARSASS
jgi:hypothetical protein